jgi:predicted ATPase
MNFKIAICGAHGTGKTTLLNLLATELNLPTLARSMRSFWQEQGIYDFEKLPAEVRTYFQHRSLLNQIQREDGEGEDGFITDRSVLDYLGYSLLSADMGGVALETHKALIRERLKIYTHFIYTPVEFPASDEPLRANVATRERFASLVEPYVKAWRPENHLVVTGSVEERMQLIRQYLQNF